MNFYIESYKRKSKSAAAKAASTAATPSIEPAAQEASGVQDLPAGEVPALPTLPTKADQSGIPAESLEAAVPDAAPLEDINNNSSRTELLESVKKLAEEPLCEADESKVEGSTAEDVFTEAQTKQQQEPTGLRQRLVVEHGEETRTGSTQLAELASGWVKRARFEVGREQNEGISMSACVWVYVCMYECVCVWVAFSFIKTKTANKNDKTNTI